MFIDKLFCLIRATGSLYEFIWMFLKIVVPPNHPF